MMVEFIDRHRTTVGVEPICRTLQIAPSAYYERKRQKADPEQRSSRQKVDEALRVAIRRVWDDNFQAYGARKVWRQLRREGIDVARCSIERLMRDMGLRGVVRGRFKRTTIPADKELRPLDLVQRRFVADRPNQLWVADFLRRDLVWLRLCRLCRRRIFANDRRLARFHLDERRSYPRCA